ncbi:MAG: hypothetical protein WBF77_00940 [Sulfurimonadaceae bacterium]
MKRYLLLLLLPLCLFAIELSEQLRLISSVTLNAKTAINGNVANPLPDGRELINEGETSFNNSVFTVQLEADLSDDLTFVAQGVLSNHKTQEVDYNLQPSLELLYISYDFGHDLLLKAGEMKIPFLKGLELKNVGYAYLWSSPKVPNSGVNGFESYRGVDLLHHHYLNGFEFEAELSLGQTVNENSAIDDKYYGLLGLEMNYEQSWVRTTLGEVIFDFYDPNGARLIEENSKMFFASIESEVKLSATIMNMGYTYSQTEMIPNDRILYASLAYAFDDLTPYLLYTNKRLVAAQTPPPLNFSQPIQKEESDRYAVGMRYDFMKQMDLKVEYEYAIYSYSNEADIPSSSSLTIALDVIF